MDLRNLGARVLNFLSPEATGWSFVTSSGMEASVGLPVGKIVSGGGAVGHFYVRKKGDDTIYSLAYGAVSVGLGLGTPVSASDSEFDWPGHGIGEIYKLPGTIGSKPPDSFLGQLLIDSINVSVTPLVSSGLGGNALEIVFFGGSPLALAEPFNPLLYKYVGLVYSSFAGTPGIGLTGYLGEIVKKEVYKA
jgi:hypothetical protein